MGFVTLGWARQGPPKKAMSFPRPLASALVASAATGVVCFLLWARRKHPEDENTDREEAPPSWIKWNEDRDFRPLRVREWTDMGWRKSEGGWVGHDYCHDAMAGVRISDYHWNSTTQELVGIASFTIRAESHKKFCHGGSMTAVMDDVIGWAGFCVAASDDGGGAVCLPWSGFTVQIDTALRKPVPVGSRLELRAKLDRREGPRKVYFNASLTNEDGAAHCEAKGLFLLSKK